MFYQFPVSADCYHLQGLLIPTIDGGWEEVMCTRLLMGSSYAPAVVCNFMHGIFSGVQPRPYMDDLAIVANTGATDPSASAFQNFAKILQIAQEYNLPINAKKTQANKGQIQYLGRITDGKTIWPAPDSRLQTATWARPNTLKQLRSFIGFVNYYRDCLPRLSTTVAPLTSMIDAAKPKGYKLRWNTDQAAAWQEALDLLGAMEPLHHIDPSRPLEVYSDASDYGMGYLLAQHDDDNHLLVIAHGSKKFTSTQLRYDTYEKELMGIYSAIMHFKPYLLPRPFIVHTDHRNLTFLLKSTTPKHQRWLMALQEFDFTIHHVAGIINPADYPSRV